MDIIRYEKTFWPQCEAGRKFADTYEKKTREEKTFQGRTDSDTTIEVITRYVVTIEDEELEEE